MKREMTRLALGGKWGEARMEDGGWRMALSLAKRLGLRREARAAPPMPVAVRLKKWRRVRRRWSWRWRFMGFLYSWVGALPARSNNSLSDSVNPGKVAAPSSG